METIHHAEQHYNRPVGSVGLLAVSKGRTVEEIVAAAGVGLYRFAESYVQEALPKILSLAHLNLEWHFIGAVQRNKARKIAERFAWVHSVNHFAIAESLSVQRSPYASSLNICLQVNLTHESSKRGIHQDQVLFLAEEVQSLPRLKLRGLMTIAAKDPKIDEPSAVFHKLHELYCRLNDEGYGLDTLSMGMSEDFIMAVAEGATLVRLGKAIFGVGGVSATERLIS